MGEAGLQVSADAGSAPVFEPVANGSPRRLSAEQIDRYNKQGYISPLPGLGEERAEANRAYFDRLMSGLDSGQSYAINCFQARLAGVWDICTDPVILDHVEDLLGPDFVCWASHFFCKLPRDPKAVPWHQDAVFWHLEPTRTVTVWLAIDDADEENSAMEFIPGTHLGRVAHRDAGEGSVLSLETDGAGELGEPFSNNLKAGEFSMHADMLVHGSRPNGSDRRRCGLTLRYCPTSVRMTDDKWAAGVEAIVCRGEDPSGRWRHHPRPSGDELDLDRQPLNIGGN